MMRFVTLDEARATRGLRLVVLEGVPSPWSETAKGCFDMKGIDYVAVKLTPRDTETRVWTGHQNAPVALYEDEPPRANWKDIVNLAERIAPTPRLVPEEGAAREEFWRVGDELLSANGLAWCLRLVLIHEGIASEGARGFPLRAAQYLAPKYGYTPESIRPARGRIVAVLEALARRLSDGRRYLMGAAPMAVDIAVASTLGLMVPLPEASCPMLPAFRRAYETLAPELRATIAPALIAHRDFMYAHHLTLPVRC